MVICSPYRRNGDGGGGWGGGGLWSYVHHTVDVKILCSDVVRPSGVPFIF